MTQVYLDKPEQWDALAERCRRGGVIGLDTEFHGLDVRKQSTVGRARVHVWSVALRSGVLHPRGYHKARGWVLPGEALRHPSIRSLLTDPSVRKEAHNLSVDHHALENEGVVLAGARCTLSLTRWKFPQFVSAPGRFGLKAVMDRLLGRRPVAEFLDVVADQRTEEVRRTVMVAATECSCGVPGCRLRKGHDKTKVRVPREHVRERTVKFNHPLESVVPGHPRWDLLVRYAADDAVAALELAELCDAEGDPDGWVYTKGPRPGHSTAVDDAVIAMESVGIPVDTGYCAEQLAAARGDEDRDLLALRRWYAEHVGDLSAEEVDRVWASHAKKAALFDDLGFPRSPVWKKGGVKRGEVKLDGAAQAWIGKNHLPARPLMVLLLHLQRVRSGKKYLEKAIASGGLVYPTCGPAGDADERVGAVTGRLGVKGELEAQQLPSREDVDLYQVKKSIIPWVRS